MSTLDWIAFAVYLGGLVAIGVWTAGGSRTPRGFFVGDRAMPWWVIGLSVMATQASAITLIGTTGLGYEEGLRFVQFYFGLPVALVILCVTLVPLYHKADVFTAYELLGRRFDKKTRTLAAGVFLALRCLSLGIVIYAPSVVLAMLLGWELAPTVAAMTIVAIAYTMIGGIRAVMWTDVAQMLLILVALVLCMGVMLARLPGEATLGHAFDLARLTDRTRMIDLSFDPTSRYTLWSGLLGGTFLSLAYFGCDQSQVQRFLTGRSLRDTRLGLLFNAVFKIPVQLLVLSLGLLLFSVFHFERPPLVIDATTLATLEDKLGADEVARFQARYDVAHEERRASALELWGQAEYGAVATTRYASANRELELVREELALQALEAEVAIDETNTVFPFFVLNYLPVGLAGILIAAIFAAAMSSIDSEVNALATTAVVDIYRPLLRPGADDAHLLRVTRVMTLVWGTFAAVVALYAAALGSVIEAVNAIGSYFYGSLLGVFVLAYAVPRANGHGAFAGLLAGMAAVALAKETLDVAWLWLNPIGTLACVLIGWMVSLFARPGLNRSGTGSGRAAGTS